MKTHNVLFLIESLNVGGSELFLEKFLSRLDLQTFRPLVCCLVEKGKLAQQIEERGVRVVSLGWHLGSVSSTILVVCRLARLLRSERIDLLHTFFYRPEILGAFAGKLARTPVVVASQHDVMAPGGKVSKFLLRVSRLLVGHVIANCQAGRRYRQKLTGHRRERISVVYIGLTEEELSAAAGEEQSVIGDDFFEKGPVVTCAGRLYHVKGQDVFLRAAASVSRANPEVRFLLIGDGPMKAELLSLAGKLGLVDVVHMPGEIRPLKGIFGKSSVVVSPSRSEGFPSVILEAMAVGTPVVASRVGGVEELVQDRVDGFVFESEKSEELASIVSMLLSRRELAIDASAKAKEKVSRKFRFEDTARQIEVIYRALLANAVKSHTQSR